MKTNRVEREEEKRKHKREKKTHRNGKIIHCYGRYLMKNKWFAKMNR